MRVEKECEKRKIGSKKERVERERERVEKECK